MKRIAARLWDLPCVILLLLAQLVVYQRLAMTTWTSNLEIVGVLTMIGVILGLAYGSSRFRPAAVFWQVLGYSLAIFPLVMGGVLNDGSPWPERIANLGNRLGYSFFLFVTQKPVEDPLLFVAFISLCFWIISLTAGYSLTRSGNFTVAALPGGVALFIIQLYDSGSANRVAFLAVYLFLCLLLLGRLTFVRNRLFWQEHRVWFSSESTNDINLVTLLVALLLVVLTWLVPVSNQPVTAAETMWKNLTQPLEQVRKDLGNAITGLKGSPSTQGIDFYGDNLSLGNQAVSGTDVVFNVGLPVVQVPVRYYWQARTYDEYLDGTWRSTAEALGAVFAGRFLNVADNTGIPVEEFSFVFPKQSIATLITPTRPVEVNHAAILSYFPAASGQIDPLIFRLDPALPPGKSYRVKAVVVNPSVIDLRNAGDAYPEWVRAFYLQLPSDLPASITQLAQQITAGLGTPFDKAQAITQYLRNNIHYVETVPSAPPGQDPLVWFLFTYKAGYCNYYATAEVMLLRAVGVPARMAVGYAEGTTVSTFRFTVQRKDAHAWPEVYFPGLGWVEFEPTASQPPLDRPSGIQEPTQEAPASTPLPRQPVQERNPAETGGASSRVRAPMSPLMRLVIILGVLAVIIALGWIGLLFNPGAWVSGRLERFFHRPIPVLLVNAMGRLSLAPPRWLERWAFLASLSPITRSFSVVYQGLQRLGARPSPTQTPAEAAGALLERLPQATQEIRLLLKEYQMATYGDQSSDWIAARRAADAIRRQSLLGAMRLRLASFRRSLFRKNQ